MSVRQVAPHVVVRASRWPIGDLDLFADLDLSEDEMEQVLDDLDAYPDEMLDAIVERIGLAEEYARASESARV